MLKDLNFDKSTVSNLDIPCDALQTKIEVSK